MATAKKKKSKKEAPTPETTYPESPHIIGMDWIELPVRSPSRSAERYLSLGFSPRGSTGQNKAVAIGGTVLLFKRRQGTIDESGVRPTGVLLQMPVDNIQLKRQQLIDLGLKPSTVRRQQRGDQAFQWCDEDGHTVRFVGPARRSGDKTLCD